MSPLKRANNLISGLILLIGGTLAAIFAIPLLNIPGNYDVVIVRSGSMEPTIGTGAIAFFKPEAEYKAQDILVFQVKDDPEESKYAVLHRAVEVTEDENGQPAFITKGDANEAKDAVQTPQERIRGKVFFHVPVVGFIITWMQSTTGKVLLIVVPVVLIVYQFGQDFMNKHQNKKTNKPKASTNEEEKEIKE